jgi:hypothetical protein
MTEPLPPTPSGTDLPPIEPSPKPAKPKWPLSRVILFTILAICLAMLGFDYFHGRRAQEKAFDLLKAKLPEEAKPEKATAAIVKDEFFTQDDVHKALGRDPDVTESDPKKAAMLVRDAEGAGGVRPDMVEIYHYTGALRTYIVRVAYIKGGSVNGAPSYVMVFPDAGTESFFASNDE